MGSYLRLASIVKSHFLPDPQLWALKYRAIKMHQVKFQGLQEIFYL